jgi:DUF2934 family protein
MQETPRKKPTTTKKRTAKHTAHEMRFPSQDEIALRAYQLYEKAGRPGGRHVEFWLEAERQLRNELNS